MKKIGIILLLPLSLFSQNFNNSVGISSNFNYESNSLNLKTINQILFEGFINDSMKNKWIENTYNSNTIYTEIKNSVKFTHNFSNKHFNFEVIDMNIINLNYTKDLIKILLNGNFNYQNESLNFSNSTLRADRYQQFKLTYGKKKEKSSFSTSVSYIKGNHHISYNISRGNLYTGSYGQYIDLEYDLNTFITDTSNFDYFAHNGNGLAFDIYSRINLKKYELEISLKDLGFIMWNSNSVILANDSNFNFQGIEIENIYDFNDSIINESNLIDNIKKSNNSSFKSYIPATFKISISGKTDKSYLNSFNLGMILKWQPYMDNTKLSFQKIQQGLEESNYKPLFFANTVIDNITYKVLPSISYGGYSENTNVGLAFSTGERISLLVGTYHIESIFKHHNTTELSFYVNLNCKF